MGKAFGIPRLLFIASLGLASFSVSMFFGSPAVAKSDYENVKVYGDKTVKDLMEAYAQSDVRRAAMSSLLSI